MRKQGTLDEALPVDGESVTVPQLGDALEPVTEAASKPNLGDASTAVGQDVVRETSTAQLPNAEDATDERPGPFAVGRDRTLIHVTADTADYAKRFGAYYDDRVGMWVCEGEVPPELMNLAHRASATVVARTTGPTHVLEAFPTPDQIKRRHDPEQCRVIRLALEQHKGRPERVRNWFATPMVDLGMRPPSEFLSTPEGRLKVEALLLRLYD